ncbi:hypothetical protein Acr_13g0009340 [Actinidia rufa]|uniref:Uncharacterized protein n=1 Tax=Actinidia rufa TaxID=165716 RepID=A0A7J0FLG4_9ERIC|nr:hypothetical protein Acr_13g0009340 [Actinidia rufa]
MATTFYPSKTHWHLSLLKRFVPSQTDPSSRLIYSYHTSTEGFAARLSELELRSLRKFRDVVAIRPDRRLEIHTTYSYKFLGLNPAAQSAWHGMMRKMIKRRLTNVGSPNSIYSVEVVAPEGVKVRVRPRRLVFKHVNQSLRYRVWFISRKRTVIDNMSFAQGHLIWVSSHNGLYRVRSPISVTWAPKKSNGNGHNKNK